MLQPALTHPSGDHELVEPNASAPQTMVSANIGYSQHLPSNSATPVRQGIGVLDDPLSG